MPVQEIDSHEDLSCLTEKDLIKVNGKLAVFLPDETKAHGGSLTFLTRSCSRGFGASLEIMTIDGPTEVRERELHSTKESKVSSYKLTGYPISERKVYQEMAKEAGL